MIGQDPAKFKQLPLHEAASNYKLFDVEVSRKLLEAGADPNARDPKDGKTPLHIAAVARRPELCRLFVEYGADIYALDEDEVAPIHLAAKYGSAQILEYFLGCGQSIEIQDGQGWRPIHYAARYGNNSLSLKVLMTKGADLEARNFNSETPLHLAATGGMHETCKVLMAAGVDVNARDKYDYVPLHNAALGEGDIYDHCVLACRLLLASGADIHARSIYQHTPLHFASMNGRCDICQLLLDAGADPYARDTRALTPVDHISSLKKDELTGLFERYGLSRLMEAFPPPNEPDIDLVL